MCIKKIENRRNIAKNVDIVNVDNWLAGSDTLKIPTKNSRFKKHRI